LPYTCIIYTWGRHMPMSVEDPAQVINTVTQLQGAGLHFVSLNIAMTSTGLCKG